MRCPVDQSDLVMSERQGVEIDYCPTCRGIWLDRGELDKILDRAAAQPTPAPAPPRDEPRYRDDDRHRYRPDGYHDDRSRDPRYDPRRKRKESWLGDLFDF